MARLKIKDAPLLTNVIGTEKIPTGSRGDFAITPDMLTQYFINKIPFVTQAQLASVKAELEAKITTVETTLSQSISLLDGRVSSVESAMLGFTQDLSLHVADQNNPHNVTKQQIGLGSVDNTSDINKPLSTATKEYVDSQILLASKGYNLDYFSADKIYPIHSEIMLASGVVVKSLINDNTTNPNLDMTSWVRVNSTEYITNSSGETQESINKKLLERIGRTLDIDDFKTATNTDSEAFLLMLNFAKNNNIKDIQINRDVTIDKRLTLTQDNNKWLDNMTINTKGYQINWTGVGANSLYLGVFEIKGVLTSDTTTVVGDVAEYVSNLTVADASIFKVGDYILIDSTSIALPDIYLNHLVRIESIVGNTIQTDTIRRLALRPSVAQVNVTKVNVVEGFKLIGNSLITASNQTSRANGIGGIQAQYCVNSQFICKSEKLWFKTIRLDHCSKSTAIAESSNPSATDGGEGYSIQLDYCTYCVAKSISYNMRHAVDLTASWHNNIIDSLDFNSTSASYGCHCAYEYNNHFWRCESHRSAQYGFQFGVVTGMFADYTDQNYLHDCTVYESYENCVTFANKGKGLVIDGGYYQGRTYSIITSNNNTTISNAELRGGIQLASSVTMFTDGYCEINNCKTLGGSSSRAVNLLSGRKINFKGGTIGGLFSLSSNTTFESENTAITYPYNTNLIASGSDNGSIFRMKGGELISTVNSTAPQTNITSEFSLENVKFSQVEGAIVQSFSAPKVRLQGCTGSGRFSFNGTTVKDLILMSNILSAVSTAPLITVINMTTDLVVNNNILKSSNNTVVLQSSTVPVLQMLNNNISGTTSIPDVQVTKCVVKNNVCKGTTTFPVATVSKLVADNILS